MSATTSTVEAGPTAAGKDDEAAPFVRSTRNWRVLPIPRRLQYDPARPFEYSTLLICIFGFASTMTVRPSSFIS